LTVETAMLPKDLMIEVELSPELRDGGASNHLKVEKDEQDPLTRRNRLTFGVDQFGNAELVKERVEIDVDGVEEEADQVELVDNPDEEDLNELKGLLGAEMVPVFRLFKALHLVNSLKFDATQALSVCIFASSAAGRQGDDFNILQKHSDVQ